MYVELQLLLCSLKGFIYKAPVFRCKVLSKARVEAHTRAFFAFLTSQISFLASLQTSSLTVRTRRLYQVPE